MGDMILIKAAKDANLWSIMIYLIIRRRIKKPK